MSLLGLVFASGLWIVASSGLLGFAASSLFIIVVALPPILGKPHDVHRTSAGMFTIAYSCAVAIPIFSGVLWEITKGPITVFLPLVFCAVVIIVVSFGLRLGHCQ